MVEPLEHYSGGQPEFALHLRVRKSTYGKNMSGSNHLVHLFHGMRQYTDN